MKNAARIFVILFPIWLAVPAWAGTFADDFEDYLGGGAFANATQPGRSPVNGWWSESYYWKQDEAGASVATVSPLEPGPGGGRSLQLFGLNDTPRVSNFFGPHEQSGVSYDGSVGQALTGSGIRVQWDAFSSARQHLTFQILDQSGAAPAVSLNIKPDGLWVNGVNLGLGALGTGEAAWRRFEISDMDLAAGTFALKVAVWDTGAEAFKECYAGTGLVLLPQEAPRALQSFVAFFDGITGGYEAVLLDNFQVVAGDQ